MGYELEVVPPAAADYVEVEPRAAALERRWQRANERLAALLADYTTLCRRAEPGQPEWLAAQLDLAEARQRCRALVEEAERLVDVVDDADYRR
jgi:sugar-specific transcriptional regulator TrmB